MRFGVATGLALLGFAASGTAMAGDKVPIGAMRLTQPVTIPVLPEFRLRVMVPPSEPNWRMQGPEALTKRGGAVIDFYPFDGNFHLSAGGRLFDRNAARSSDPASLALLPAFRLPGLRTKRKFTPTMLMGYSRTDVSGLAVGIDAGVLVGQTDPMPEYRINDAEGPRAPGGLNGLARFTMRYPF